MKMTASERCHLARISNPKLSNSELTFAFYAQHYGYGVATRMALLWDLPYERVLDLLGVPTDYINADRSDIEDKGEAL
jgi:hypothetical protein